MDINKVEVPKVSKLLLVLVENVSCLECCKFYTNPEKPNCGHSLCRNCWKGRRSCPICLTPLDKKLLKLNAPLQSMTERVHILVEAFEKLFSVKLDEYVLELQDQQNMSRDNKNVNDWLASSQNQFSATGPSTQDIYEVSHIRTEIVAKNTISHTDSKTINISDKVLHKSIPQDDWDKIEQMPETEEYIGKNKENIVGPMDIEPFFIENNEYTTNKPRRSLRKKDSLNNDVITNYNDVSISIDDKRKNSNESSNEFDKKTQATIPSWSNVKRMRKEFSKLNKMKRNKLNVSIEKCKKTQSVVNQPNVNVLTTISDSEQAVVIDEDTPNLFEIPKQIPQSEKTPIIENKKCASISAISPLPISKVVTEKTEQVKHTTKVPFSIKSTLQKTHSSAENVNNSNSLTLDTDDIEINIRVGNSLTNIVIRKKQNNIELKVNSDREVQTSLDEIGPLHKSNINVNVEDKFKSNILVNTKEMANLNSDIVVTKTTSSKKNTESADTVTATYEITESVEKELSKVMDAGQLPKDIKLSKQPQVIADKSQPQSRKRSQLERSKPIQSQVYIETDDLDVFGTCILSESNVSKLQTSKNIASEILVSTANLKSGKRVREEDVESLNSKKMKTDEVVDEHILNEANSENYDAIMGDVFANIDADIQNSSKKINHSKTINQTQLLGSQLLQTKLNTQNSKKDIKINIPQKLQELADEKYSENVFSIIEKENDSHIQQEYNANIHKVPGIETQHHIDNLLTPGMCQDFDADDHDVDMATPQIDNDESDRSVVEETPQKNVSFPKPKLSKQDSNKTVIAVNEGSKSSSISKLSSSNRIIELDSEKSQNIINLSDTTLNRDATITNASKPKQTLETPLNINKFVDHITYKSTPVARKSLNFISANEDIDQTLCPTITQAAKTTQEMEFMSKAFERTPKSLAKKPQMCQLKKHTDKKKYCLAGSCLSAAETTNLKLLCSKFEWSYVDKYTEELTHLVVGVDDENKSQRSVKYMCALASSKWIVSYAWIEKCLQMKQPVDEECFEAMDGTGEPGPRRSRLAKRKLFQDITFYCMPPFSVLDVNTLKNMLESAGGRVVTEARSVRITGSEPSLLLAEPENTQEDRFIYLAMELNIVPVNYEWALNCLGSYSLGSIHELLLCPAALLPKSTELWPTELISKEVDLSC